MNKDNKRRIKLNLVSLALIAVSFISVTLAWFAYSGLSDVTADVNVKAWNIELEKDGQKVTNDIILSTSDLYPGMEPVTETITIRNLGDSDADVNYSIVSARILGDAQHNFAVDGLSLISENVEDKLAHDYPFNINISLSKGYAKSKGDESHFEVSLSWPLDSGNNEIDSQWGTKAYNFQKSEEQKKEQDSNYQIQPSIKIVISLAAEQYLEIATASDTRYDLGSELLFDVVNNRKCETLSTSCLKTYILDVDNKNGDETVSLLPNPLSTYLSGNNNDYNTLLTNLTSTWQTLTRPLLVEDILKIISRDVKESVLIRDTISNTLIGSLKYENRIITELNKSISSNGYYQFSNEKFNFLSASECYWTNSEYDLNRAFAIQKQDDTYTTLSGNNKASSCKIIPVIIANKTDLN